MLDRVCERCGGSLEHIHPSRLAGTRFCGGACRRAWHREQDGENARLTALGAQEGRSGSQAPSSPDARVRAPLASRSQDPGSVQAQDLVDCEAVIERGLATFVAVGDALVRIRDERLYRATHRTFEAYCRERWQLGRKRAYDLIGAASVAAELSPMGDTQPSSERVARELAPLRGEPTQLREAWSEVVEKHGPAPTAAQVREIVRAPAAPAAGPVDQCVVPPVLQAALRSAFTIVGRAAVRDGGVYVGSEFEGGVRWVNPPARAVARWVRAASEYSSFPGCVAVCVVPVDTTAAWWWDYCRRAEVRFLREPLVWDQAGEALAPVASAVVVFGARRASVLWWDLPSPSAQAETPKRAPVDGEDGSGAGGAPAEGVDADAELARLVAKGLA